MTTTTQIPTSALEAAHLTRRAELARDLQTELDRRRDSLARWETLHRVISTLRVAGVDL